MIKRQVPKILSLGAGVQSSTLLLLSCKGELPKLDYALFADTQWEPPWVYENLKYLGKIAEESGIPVYKISRGNLREDSLDRLRYDYEEEEELNDSLVGGATIPVYTLDTSNGHEGMMKRQCTREYKVSVISRFIRNFILKSPRRHLPLNSCEVWLGISTDESKRVRSSSGSKDKWISNKYPLIFELGMSRNDCVEWLRKNGFEIPKRSACIGCPFRSNSEWLEIKKYPELWDNAVRYDNEIRELFGKHSKLNSLAFLHRSRVPLQDADLSVDQPRSWDEECLGMCNT